MAASLFPVLIVQCAGLVAHVLYTKEDILAHAASALTNTTAVGGGLTSAPWVGDILDAVRAIVPLLVFLMVVLRFLCREPFPTAYVRADAGDFEYAIRVEVPALLLPILPPLLPVPSPRLPIPSLSC